MKSYFLKLRVVAKSVWKVNANEVFPYHYDVELLLALRKCQLTILRIFNRHSPK